jgi:hypothetical protein
MAESIVATTKELVAGSIQLPHGLKGSEAGPNGSLGIVRVGDRSTEHGHDGSADELLHCPIEPVDMVLYLGLVLLQEVANVLRIRPIES